MDRIVYEVGEGFDEACRRSSDDISIKVDLVLAIFSVLSSGSLHNCTLASRSSLPSRHVDQNCVAA